MNTVSSPWRPDLTTVAVVPSRRRRRQNVPAAQPAHRVDTVTICALAGSLGAGTATIDDMRLAEKLLLALAQMLPPDGAIGIDP
jgi:hypothetical protein